MVIMQNEYDHHNLANLIAIENQLQAEEKWIIGALKKIRKQRHSLEVEKLHLKSLRTHLRKLLQEKLEAPTSFNVASSENVMQQIPVTSNISLDTPIAVRDDLCNDEELNLTVSNFVDNMKDSDVEEYEDEDSEVEDLDDLDIDMNIFMNGNHIFKKTN